MLDRQNSPIDNLVTEYLRRAGGSEGAGAPVAQRIADGRARFTNGDGATGGTIIEAAYFPGKPDQDSLLIPLASPVTGLISHDMAERLAATQGRVEFTLADDGHGAVAGNVPAVMQSLALMARVCTLACELGGVLAVHWKQSEQLLPPTAFIELAAEGVPGALHVHPFLFGGDGQVGIRTFGMRHFIGREMLVQPHRADFTDHFDAMLALLRHALLPAGFPVADGDTFSLHDGGQDYQVVHHGPGDDGVPIIELLPMD